MNLKRFKSPQVPRMLTYYGHRALPRRQHPKEVALSIALGVFIGVLPTYGIAVPLTLLACQLVKLPKIPALLSSFVAIPPTLIFIFYPLGYSIGTLLIQPESIGFDFLEFFGSISFNNMAEKSQVLWSTAKPHLFAFGLGMLIVATITSAIFYYIAHTLMKNKHKNLEDMVDRGEDSFIQE